MNIKILKIILITIIVITAVIEGLYLAVLPAWVNSVLKTDKISAYLNSKTGLKLSYDNAKITTYPLFSIKLYVKNPDLKDKIDNQILKADELETTVFVPSILLKKITLKSVKAKALNFTVIRTKDKKFCLGSYPLNLNFDPKQDINLDIDFLNISDTNIIFYDRLVNHKLQAVLSNADVTYKKNKKIKAVVKANILVNDKQKSVIDIDFASKLPVSKGFKTGKVKCLCNIKNIDLSDYSKYFAYLTGKDIIGANGIINIHTQCDNKGGLVVESEMSDFSLNMKNPLDSIKSNSDIKAISLVDFNKNVLHIQKTKINADDWQLEIAGNIKDYAAENPKFDLKVDVGESDIHSMYWLVPSIEGDPQDVMQKFKKYGAWGKAHGNLTVKGNAKNPEVYGDLTAEDVYIVKDNPLVPHCKIFATFLKDKVKIKTRVFAGFGEYVDVDGIAEMKINGAGDFHVSSSKNVDLSTAEYMLVPVHEVVGFDLGPVPYMDIKGKGNIDIHTLGTVTDGEVYGQFNYKNTTVSLDGLNTVINGANGALEFKGKDMHFYSTSGFIKNQPVKIDGKANLAGDIDFDVTSPAIDAADLFEILTTSPMLDSKKAMVDPVEAVSGKVSVALKLKGIVKDFSSILGNETLNISGKIDFKNSTGKLKFAPITLQKISGKGEFNDTDWKADLTGFIGSSKVFVNGFCKDGRTDLKANASSVKTDEIIALVSNTDKLQIPKLPLTHSLVTFNAHYKSNTPQVDLNKLSAKGYFHPETRNDDFIISSGNFALNNGNFELKNFNAKLFNSKIYAHAKVQNLFSQNYRADGNLNISNFDLSSLNAMKKMAFLPPNLKKLLIAYENYSGRADVNLNCRNNKLKGKIALKDIKFEHSYFKTPVSVDRGDILLDGTKISMNSLVAQIDNTPVFLNVSLWDLDKTLKVSGYFTTKFSEYFANKYINSFLTYPIKPKGDITITADISGNINNLRIRPKMKFAPESDIYYMGANLGDESEEREINADINVTSNNVVYLKNLEYLRFMTSQNSRAYPITVLYANGIINLTKNKKDIYIRNLNIETKNNANVKMFNVIFKKSVLKKGMFNCKLNVKGNINNPHILGFVSMDNLDMPLFDTTLQDISVKFKDKTVDVRASGMVLASDFVLLSTIRNDFKPPIVIENLELKSQKLNLDTLVDSLTTIPTPNTAVKLVETGKTSVKMPLNVSDFIIKKGSMTAENIVIRDLNATNYEADFVLGKDMILNLNKLGFDVTTGKMTGTAVYNFDNGRIKANVSAYNVDSNKVASSLFGFKDQIFGNANGNIVITTKGSSEEERIKNMFGYVYFEITDGKMPKLGSVEYLLKAGNFIKSGITGVSLNNLLALIAPVKTGYFDSIKGNFALKNGVAQDIEVYSKGDNLNMYINGEFDILQNYANLRVFGRLTKRASNILGPVGNVSFNSLLSSIPGLKMNKNDKSGIIKDINKIPGVELSDQQYRVFTVKIDGDIDKEKYVKNFRWIE